MGFISTTEIRRLAVQSISSLLILLFSYVAISKLADFDTFEWQMMNQPLPGFVARVLIWAVSFSELIIVMLLTFSSLRWYGMVCSLVLMLLFTIYVGAVVLHFFHRVPCSCGGVLKSMGWEVHLVFNLFFVGLSLVGVWVGKKWKAENKK